MPLLSSRCGPGASRPCSNCSRRPKWIWFPSQPSPARALALSVIRFGSERAVPGSGERRRRCILAGWLVGGFDAPWDTFAEPDVCALASGGGRRLSGIHHAPPPSAGRQRKQDQSRRCSPTQAPTGSASARSASTQTLRRSGARSTNPGACSRSHAVGAPLHVVGRPARRLLDGNVFWQSVESGRSRSSKR
jgi:hypothetical protein